MTTGNEIAIIGLAGRFPGAPDARAFWRNLRDGVESISFFDPDELESSAVVPEQAREQSGFVPAGGVLADADGFDHDLFGLSPREARWMDPQQRVFLETAWAALEDAGYDPGRYPGAISVYAGAGTTGHLLSVLAEAGSDPASLYEAISGDNLATRVSYALRLRGESVSVQTACSTGLAVVHLAAQSLLLGQSRIALAGAVRVALPQRTGYVYADGMILSPDGHCRAFDHRAGGTVSGNGAGVVVLKRLADALADGDQIYAVLEGWAMNNEGHRSVGYTAPSVAGQTEVITEALAVAGLSSDQIGYVEAHGTGTPLGDPIEIAALTRAYRRSGDRIGDCLIGSVKTNIGHLDTAAGIAGLIKVALMLRHGEIPPSLNLEKPNPSIAFASSPFVVNTELRPWKGNGTPRRAGVSSFGIGGTNVHMVVAEGPEPIDSAPSSRPNQLITLAAHTPTALSTMATRLADHLADHPGEVGRDSPDTPSSGDDRTQNGNAGLLADVAYTMAVGRAPLRYRRSVVAGDLPGLVDSLRRTDEGRLVAGEPRVGLLFPGQGSAWHGMAAELYRAEPAFGEQLDRCVAEVEPILGRPLLPVLLDGAGPIEDTELAHGAIFAVEVALARLWLGWGIKPAGLLGHSFGEYAAACVAGVLSLAAGAELAVMRGRLVSGLPEGGMLAVGLDEAGLAPYLASTELSLAAVNGDGRCVVSGPRDALAGLRGWLDREGHACVSLPVRYAFHSPVVEPIMSDLAAAAQRTERHAPELPLVSSLTGTWWTQQDQDGTGTAGYWAWQLREPVRFAAGLDTIATSGSTGDGPLVLIEVGADQTLTSLTRAHLRNRALAVPSLRRQSGTDSDHRVLLESVGTVWSAGAPIDWPAFYRHEQRHRTGLPAYPFERRTLQPLGGGAGKSPTVADTPEPERPIVAQMSGGGREGGPRDEVEERVFEIWRERLEVEDFGIHDNFLTLGGNSLMAAQVLTRLRDTFGIPLPLEALFEAPTVAGIAGRIRAIQSAAGLDETDPGTQEPVPPIRPVPRGRELPLSVVQARTLALEAADPGNPQLVMPLVVKLDGRLDVDALRHAIEAVVRRHETLRTTFHRHKGTWSQHIEDEARISIEVEDLAGREDLAELTAREEPLRHFDLAAGPLRVRLLRLAEDRHVLLVTVHHVVCDTWSLANLMGEIATGYRALVTDGRLAPLPAPDVQYADFAAWQRELLDTGALAAQQDYWRRQLTELPPPLILPGASAAVIRRFRGRSLPIDLSADLSARLRAYDSTSYLTMLAAYAVLLGRLAGVDDLVIGTPIGNRDRAGLEPLIGYVAHAVPLRVDLSGDPSFADLVARLQQTLLSAYANPDLPYEAVVDEIDPARSGGRMFDALLVVHSGLELEQEVPGGRWSRWEVPGMPAMFGPTMAPLSMMLVDSADGFSGDLEYADELLEADSVRAVFEQFTEVLADALARPQAHVSDLGRPRITVLETAQPDQPGPDQMQLSLSYFANDEDALEGPKYRLLLEGAKLADRLGFAAIWTPERHFHPFGGLYPSPTAINAVLAGVTERIGLRAGSVVLPLHDPIRVAEEWSVIDNVSGGRAGVSFASGWHADDFVLAPDAYADRRDLMRDGIEAVRRLWRGEAISRRNGIGEQAEIRIRPRPVQPELPFWVTAAGSPATFRLAGELGGNVLTNLMGQTFEALAEKIAAYREAWRDAGHGPGDGHVTLMLHAFLADDAAQSYEQARQPLLDYFRSSVDIARGMIAGLGLDIRPEDLTESDMTALLEHGLARYLDDGGLFGTPADCVPMLERVQALGVDEVAALIDFGVPVDATLRSVELLGQLIEPEALPTQVVRVSRDKSMPLSYAQQRLWYLEQLTPQNIAYNNPVALRIRGRLDSSALQRALQEVVRRHEVLRTTFPGTGDGAVQVTAPELAVDLPIIDAGEDEVAELARDHARTPFDLDSGPLLRARLLRLSDEHHVLLVSMHHIVSDGWSAGVLLTELATLYMGAPLPELTMQYADYAVRQRELVESGALAGELDYWRSRLADVPILELPMDRPRGPIQGIAGARHPVRLDRALTDALHALCRRTGVTPYMVLHAGLTALLHRYSGQTDLAIGTAVAGRNHPETEQLVGCFVNMVVIRTDLSGDPTFGELLGRVKDATLGALAHAELPFERLVDELKVPRSLSHSPLFQAMLVLHNTPSPRVELGGLTLEGIDVDPGLSKLDLTLELREEPDGITGWFEYNTELFDPATVEQLSRHLVQLLTEATTESDRPVSDLDLMSDQERAEVLALSDGIPLHVPGDEPLAADTTVDQVFAAQAARTPDAVAIGDGARSLTYRELLEAANRIAHGLRARGVRPGRLVGVLIEDHVLAVTAQLGVLAAGGGYVPMDPRSPRARLADLAEQASPVVVLTDDSTELDGGSVVPVGEVSAGRPVEALPPIAAPADPAYVIFTSGSTGRPKGVVVEHRQLLYSTRTRRMRYGPAGNCLSLYAMTFDVSVGWIWFALLTGGTVWSPRPELVSDPRALGELIHRHGVTHLGGVPALYAQLLTGAEPGRLTSLRVATVAGEAFPPELIRTHLRMLPLAELHNEYGPTEATIYCTAHRVDGHGTGRVPIGRPLAGGLGYVLDRHGRLVSAGAIGELYAAGPGIARGYLNSPELTRERFLPDPFGPGRVYRTGDRVRWNHQGVLEFLGRTDRQVKIRGFRVEPTEVEAALTTHPAVATAAVVPVESGPNTRLVGYVVFADTDTAPTVEELRGFTRGRLPDYLVPAQLMALPALPHTPHGKLDIASLPPATIGDEAVPTLPRSELERTLAGVFASVLDRPAVGVHDNFFDLGGDSILAISVVTRARQLGAELSVRQLFQNPTVAGLAAVAGTVLALPAEQSTVHGPAALTAIQRWFFDLDLTEPSHWNMAVQLELAEPVRAELLQEAFRALLLHHDALRLRFSRGEAWTAAAEVNWTLRHIDPAELEVQAERLQADCSLSEGPMLRAALIGCEPQRLLIVAHHLVIDGVSWRIVLADLFTAYRQLAADRPIDLPPKTTSYAEWANRLPEFADSAAGRAEVEYWTGLPYARAARLPRDGAATTGAGMVWVELDADRTRQVLDEAPVLDVLLAAVVAALGRWTGSEHVQLDVEKHGREDLVPGLDVTRTVGWFSDFHPVVLEVPHDATPERRLAVVREYRRMVPRNGAGYVPLRDAGLVDVPQSEVTFNYLGRLDVALPPDAPATIVGETPGRIRADTGPYLLEITAGVLDGRLWFAWSYLEGIHRRDTIAALADHTLAALQDLRDR